MRRARRPTNVVTIKDWVAQKEGEKRRGPPSISKRGIEQQRVLAEEMRESGDWARALPGHFVALYAACHTHVYGVYPEELLDGKTYYQAQCAAARALKLLEYDNDRMIELVRWAWAREKHQHERGNGERRRMGWRLQFSPSMVTDFKVSVLAKKNQSRRGN